MRLNFEAVRRERKAQGRTATWVAEQLGIDRATYSSYETGRRECPGPIYANLVRLFNVHPMVFIGAEDPEAAIIEAAAALGIDPARFGELHAERFPDFAEEVAV
ncbi:MAG: helix-turn-helix transcriptional regulator [Actinomycetota bacterium]